MSLKSTIVVLLLAAGLYAWYRLDEGPGTKDLAELRQQVFGKLESDQIQSLRVVRDTGEIAAQRQDTGWRLTAPVEAKAASALFDQITSHMARLKYKEQRETGDDASYGLDASAIRVEAERGEGGPLVFLLGKPTPLSSEDSFYLRVEGRPGVYVAEKSFRELFVKPVDDYRNKDLFDFLVADVHGLALEYADGRNFGFRKEGDHWILNRAGEEQSVRELADRYRVDGIVNRLRSLRAESFVTDQDGYDPTQYVLDKPLVSVHLWTGQEDSAAERTVSLGRPVEGKEEHYASIGGRPGVVTVKSEVWDSTLDKELDDLREKKVLPFYAYSTTAFQVTAGDKTVSLEKSNDPGESDEDVWTFTAPEDLAGPAAGAKVAESLRELAGQETGAWVTAAPSDEELAAWGLVDGNPAEGSEGEASPSPAGRITVTEGDKDPWVLIVGGPAPEGGGVYVRRQGYTPVLLAPEAVAQFVEQAATAWVRPEPAPAQEGPEARDEQDEPGEQDGTTTPDEDESATQDDSSTPDDKAAPDDQVPQDDTVPQDDDGMNDGDQ